MRSRKNSCRLRRRSSKPYPPEVSEVDDLGLRAGTELNVDVPRIAASPVAFECTLENAIAMNDSDNHHLVIGRVLRFRIRKTSCKAGGST